MPPSMKQTSDPDNEVDSPRIQHIPYGRPKVVKPNGWCLVGVLIFISGIFGPALIGRIFGPDAVKLPKILELKSEWVIVAVCLSGLLIMAIGLIRSGQKNRRHWIRVQARCLDQDYWREWSDGPDDGKTWTFRVLCEIELNGRTYRVTPGYWSSFGAQRSVQRFLDKNIKDGMCELHVNPDDPLQTEFVGHDIKDVLLH